MQFQSKYKLGVISQANSYSWLCLESCEQSCLHTPEGLADTLHY